MRIFRHGLPQAHVNLSWYAQLGKRSLNAASEMHTFLFYHGPDPGVFRVEPLHTLGKPYLICVVLRRSDTDGSCTGLPLSAPSFYCEKNSKTRGRTILNAFTVYTRKIGSSENKNISRRFLTHWRRRVIFRGIINKANLMTFQTQFQYRILIRKPQERVADHKHMPPNLCYGSITTI